MASRILACLVIAVAIATVDCNLEGKETPLYILHHLHINFFFTTLVLSIFAEKVTN